MFTPGKVKKPKKLLINNPEKVKTNQDSSIILKSVLTPIHKGRGDKKLQLDSKNPKKVNILLKMFEEKFHESRQVGAQSLKRENKNK